MHSTFSWLLLRSFSLLNLNFQSSILIEINVLFVRTRQINKLSSITLWVVLLIIQLIKYGMLFNLSIRDIGHFSLLLRMLFVHGKNRRINKRVWSCLIWLSLLLILLLINQHYFLVFSCWICSLHEVTFILTNLFICLLFLALDAFIIFILLILIWTPLFITTFIGIIIALVTFILTVILFASAWLLWIAIPLALLKIFLSIILELRIRMKCSYLFKLKLFVIICGTFTWSSGCIVFYFGNCTTLDL